MCAAFVALELLLLALIISSSK